MPINITNITNNASQADRTNEQKQAKAVHGSEAKAKQPSSKAVLGQDSVNLTHSALRIKSLEDQIARLPIVDTQKVEQIRNSLHDGTYEFNSDRTAKKLINFEKDLI